MKKFFTDAATKITFYALLAALLFAVTTGAGSLLRVVAAAYWVIVLLGAVVGLLALIITFGQRMISPGGRVLNTLNALLSARTQ